MTTTYSSPRPVSGSLQQPEVDRAALNDVLQDQGWGVQAVNWVFEAVTGESLVATIITPITGDWSKIRADGDAWRSVGNAMNDMSYNLTDAVGKVRDAWDGEAASSHEKYIALGWKAGLLAEMGVAQLIAKGFDTVASGAEALGRQAARLLDYLINKLMQAAATVWVPVAGWIKAAEMVWNAYQIYRRVMDIIDTVKKLITDVKALFDAVGRVASALGKLKDADSLAEAMNATQEVAEGARDVRNSVRDIHEDIQSVKDSATEIGERGRDIGSTVREVYSPSGGGADGTKAASVSTPVAGTPVSAPPTVQSPGDTTAPSSGGGGGGGGAVTAPPPVRPGGGGSASAPPSGGHSGGPAVTRPDTTHAAGAAPAPAPSSHSGTPVGGAMPMGAPMTPGAGGGDTQRSGPRPGSTAAAGTPTAPPQHRPAGGSGSALPSPQPAGHSTPGSGAGTGGTSSGPRPTPGGLPSPSGQGSGLPSPSGHGSSSHGSTPGTPTGHGSGLPSPAGHGSTPGSPAGHTPGGSGSGLPSPTGHDTPRPHDTPPSGTTPHDGGTKPHDSTRPHDGTGAPTDTKPHDTKPHDTKPHDTTTPHDGTRPHDTDGTRPHDTDGKPHDTGTSGADDARPHDDTPTGHDRDPGTDRPADHDTPGNHNTGDNHNTDNHNNGDDNGGGGDGPPRSPQGHDLTPQFDNSAMAAQGEGYRQQLEHILPNEADRQRYEQLSTTLSTNLTPDEARHVADVRNQLTVGNGDIVTKALNQGAMDTYLPATPHPDGDRRQDWQTQVGGSIARGVDVVDINTPQGLRDGLALDDKGAGWTPIPANADSAMQLRYKLDATTAGEAFIPFGGPNKETYADAAEQRRYDDAAQRMADAGGVATPNRNLDPFTGTGSTGGGVPEWIVPRGTDLPDRAEIWQVDRAGGERLHAVYDSRYGWYQLPAGTP
ncbi:hypothetical protein AB0A63_36325 [Lentzea sp. NPDC042327]|uniref:hypothetical protein n=1 Tax=Lentzea sp. NPDC042327 TaxID=3154801 RepID=UPI0033DEA6ED